MDQWISTEAGTTMNKVSHLVIHLNIGLVCSCLFLFMLRLFKANNNQSVLSIYLAAYVYKEIFI